MSRSTSLENRPQDAGGDEAPLDGDVLLVRGERHGREEARREVLRAQARAHELDRGVARDGQQVLVERAVGVEGGAVVPRAVPGGGPGRAVAAPGLAVAEERREARAGLAPAVRRRQRPQPRRLREPRVDVGPVWNSNLQPDFNVRVIERFGPPLRPCFENSMRAINSSKNQPNRLRIDRAREFQSLVGTSQTSG